MGDVNGIMSLSVYLVQPIATDIGLMIPPHLTFLLRLLI
jgi:hypothetical protein